MAGEQVLRVPAFCRYVKIGQAVFAIILFCLSAYQVSAIPWSGAGMILFTSLFSIVALVYYFLAAGPMQHIYNWIAIIVLEGLANVFWLASWALMASVVGYVTTYDEFYTDGYFVYEDGSWQTFGNVVIVCLVFGLIDWILYCVFLGYFAVAVHHHTSSAAVRPSATIGQADAADKIPMEAV